MNLKDFDFRVLRNGVLINNLNYKEMQSSEFFSPKTDLNIQLYMSFKDCNGVKIFDGDILLNKITSQERIVKYKKALFILG